MANPMGGAMPRELTTEECEALIPQVASALGLGESLHYREQTIELSPPWERIWSSFSPIYSH
jgi:lysyl-tRNA synthetase class II